MRCLIWAAVSSKPQASEEKDSIPTQISAARELIQRNEDWHEVAEPLTIPGHSRAYLFLHDIAEDVPQYRQVMSLARQGTIDLLICRSRDRLGRSDALIAQLEGYLRSYGCQVYSLEMPSPLLDPEELRKGTDRAGIWSAAIERARAEDELSVLRRRHHFGMQARTRRGLHPNRIPYGYRMGPDGIGVIYEPEAKVVRLIFDWFTQGMSFRAIAQNVPAYATERYPKSRTISYVVRNPYYGGFVAWSRLDLRLRSPKPREEWVLAEGLHQPIVSRETWEEAQREYKRRRNKGPRYPYTRYPLSGLVHCGYCGRRMRLKISGSPPQKYRYYVCGKPGCVRNTVRADDVEGAVADRFRVWGSDPSALRAELDAALDEANTYDEDAEQVLRDALAQKEAALARWVEDYEMGLLSRSEFYLAKARIEGHISRTKSELAAIVQQPIEPDNVEKLVTELADLGVEDLAAAWRDQENVMFVKSQLRAIGLRVGVTEGRLEIGFDFA